MRGQPHGVAIRLGLHTGPVVVGPLAQDPQRLYTAGGDTLARATRLQQQATSDTVLCSAATYALVQAEVQGEAWTAGPHDTASPSEAGYVVHDLLRRRAGVPQRAARPLSRLVGRTRELALLHERLALAARGQGQVMGIAGEPGMGKSRLLAEFVQRLAGQSVTYCEGHCLAYGSTIPYLPIRDLLRQLWSLSDTAAPDILTATIEQWLNAAGIGAEVETLLLPSFSTCLGRRQPWQRSALRRAGRGPLRCCGSSSSPPVTTSHWCWRWRTCTGATPLRTSGWQRWRPGERNGDPARGHLPAWESAALAGALLGHAGSAVPAHTL